MSNKVRFATNEYVQEEISKLKQDVIDKTDNTLKELSEKHDRDITLIKKEIKDLQTTVENDIGSAITNINTTINDMKVEINEDLDQLSKNILVENIAYTNSNNNNIQNVKDALDFLLYTDLNITIESSAPYTNEMGTNLSNLQLTWTYNRPIVSQSVDNVEMHKDSRAYGYPTNVNTDKNIIFRVNDGTKDFSKTLSYKFMSGVYSGACNKPSTYNSAFILGLTKKLQPNNTGSLSVNCGSGQYIYYATPKRYSKPTFTVNGFEGGFSKVSTLIHTNDVGYSEEYDIWMSSNHSLGSISINIK